MIVIKIIALLVGSAFTLFGYFIFFKKKYSLINGFEEAFKAGQKTEDYARRIGLAEFIIGIALLVVAAILFLFTR